MVRDKETNEFELIASAYKEIHDFYSEVAEIDKDSENAQEKIEKAKKKLKENGIKEEFKNITPETHPALYLCVPIFEVILE